MKLTQTEIAACLQDFADRHGGIIEVDDLIKEVRADEHHPLREKFEWNVDKAAWEHWRTQARALIRSVKLNPRDVTSKNLVTSAPMLVQHPARENGYTMLKSLKGDPDNTHRLICSECKSVLASISRLESIVLELADANFEDAFAEVRAAMKRIMDQSVPPHQAAA